ncbi:MAG: DUF5666 domain-containing protein [Chloroflexia bacterium]
MEIKRLGMVIGGIVVLAAIAVGVLVFNSGTVSPSTTFVPASATASAAGGSPTAVGTAQAVAPTTHITGTANTALAGTDSTPTAAGTAAGTDSTPTAGSGSTPDTGNSLDNGTLSQPVRQVTGKITDFTSGGGGFTLTAQNNHVYTVTTGSQTWIVISQDTKRVVGTLADLKVGDRVMVAGLPDATDGIDARVVLPAAAAVTAQAGAKTPKKAVGTSAATSVPGATTVPGATAVPGGSSVPGATSVPGTPGANGTPGVTAQKKHNKKKALPTGTPGTPEPGAVAQATAEPKKHINRRNYSDLGPAGGIVTIQSIANGVLILKTDNASHPATVTTDAHTIVIKGGLVGVDALQPGDKVEIRPQLMAAPTPVPEQSPAPGTTATPRPLFNPNKTVMGAAGLIYVPSPDHRLLSGTVKSVDGANFTLVTFGGDYTFTTDAQTVYQLIGALAGGNPPHSPADLTLGSRVFVYSAKTAAGQTTPALVVLAQP